MSDRPASISVVIPCFMEQAGIAATVTAVHGHLLASGRQFEIIVVDNASTDRTVDQVAGLGLDDVRLLVNDTNRGKGYSVRRGMLEACFELRLHCDADCAASLASLAAMESLIDSGADVVVGSRLARGARIGQRQPLARRVMGSSFQRLCMILLSDPTRDRFCGFKLWTAASADAVFPLLSLNGWTFDAEALGLARGLGFSVVETGIDWTDRDGSRLSMGRILLPVTVELLRARRNIRRSVRAVDGRPR